jgi:regulator of sigma E protease
VDKLIAGLGFLLALGILIPIHEWGHFRVARACGIKVLRFSVGFGQVLWRRVARDGTEFVISAIPLGGYVRMLDEREGPVPPAELKQSFNQRPLLQRAAVVAAGPAANWLLAIALFTVVAWIGSDVPKPLLGTPLPASLAERAGLRAGDLVQAVSADGEQWQPIQALPELQSAAIRAQALGENLHLTVGDAHGRSTRRAVLETERLAGRTVDGKLLAELGLAPFAEPVISQVTEGGAGAAAGLQAGDRVLNSDGHLIPDASSLRATIRAARDGEQALTMRWQIDRAGRLIDLQVTPRIVDDSGQRIGRLDVGVGAPLERIRVSYDLLDGVWRGISQSWDMAVTTVRLIGRMLTGQASLKNLGGPLSIADYAGQSAQAGLVPYLAFLAQISMSLAVLNLLPLPMLDGGHLMYHLFEGLSGRPVSEWWQRQLQRAGALILVLMMALAFTNDVVTRFPG